MEQVAREIAMDASPAEVWEILAGGLGGWFGADVEGTMEPGEPLHFVWPDGTHRRAVVERVDPERELVLRWIDDPSRVAIRVEPHGDQTIVRVVEKRIDAAVSPAPEIGFKALVRT